MGEGQKASTMPDFTEVEKAEKDQIDALRRLRGVRSSSPKVGLAFSCSGIRRATFNIGFLQGLARAEILRKVDYLSTVSGGGYIGAWLISWIERAGGVQAVESKLGRPSLGVNSGAIVPEPGPVNFLRDYSNYSTPRKGISGADTWAAIAS